MARTYRALSLTVLPAALAVTAARPAAAQDPPPPATRDLTPVAPCPAGCEAKRPREGFGSGGVSVGVGLLSLGDLNDRLEGVGFEKLPTTSLVLSGHGRGGVGSFVFGGRGGAFVGGKAGGPEGLEASYTMGWGGAELGYAAVNSGPLSVLPMLVLGGYGMSIDVTDNVARTFDATLTTPTRNTEIDQAGVLLGASVPVDLRIDLQKDDDDDHAGVVIGLEPTFLFGIPVGDLSSGGKGLTDGPKAGLTGGYVALSVGGGTW